MNNNINDPKWANAPAGIDVYHSSLGYYEWGVEGPLVDERGKILTSIRFYPKYFVRLTDKELIIINWQTKNEERYERLKKSEVDFKAFYRAYGFDETTKEFPWLIICRREGLIDKTHPWKRCNNKFCYELVETKEYKELDFGRTCHEFSDFEGFRSRKEALDCLYSNKY